MMPLRRIDRPIHLAASAFFLLLSACEETPPAVAPTAPLASSSAAPAVESKSGAVACTFKAEAAELATMLFVTPDLPAYGQAYMQREKSAVIPVGDATLGAKFALRSEAWEFTGVMPARALDLHPTRPIVLADLVLPWSYTKLHYARGEGGALAILTKTDERFDAEPKDSRVPCADLSIGETPDFEPRVAIGGFGLDKKARVRGDGAVELSNGPGGSRVAVMNAGGERQVHVIAEEKGYSRIAWHTYGGYVVGWVASSLLDPSPDFVDSGYGTGGGFGSSSHNVHTCPSDVPLFVAFEPTDELRAKYPRMDETPHAIGTLRAHAEFSRYAPEGDYERVGLHDAFATDAHFLVRAADLAACTKASP